MPVEVGPFVIERHIADGGMGSVWRGRHALTHVPVAVKVVTAERAREPRYYRRFLREVRAVAKLAHPAIVMVLDYGTLPAGIESKTDGWLTGGSPYLVMEYAGGGPLRRSFGPLRWGQLHPILVALLNGLAHAHARGLVHRDLKHANVLLPSRRDLRPGLKLTDFGLAQTVTKSARKSRTLDSLRDRPVGTPHYMAPEQFKGAWRDYGPWTDLYALGIMSFELATGRSPFAGESVWEMALAHTRSPLPEMELGGDYPAGFEAWVRTCCAKSPYARFRRAADGALALAELGPPPAPEPLDHMDTGWFDIVDPAETDLDPSTVERRPAIDVGAATVTGSPEGIFVEGAGGLVLDHAKIGLGTLDALETIAGQDLAKPWRTSGVFEPAEILAAQREAQTPTVFPSDWRMNSTTAASVALAGVGLGLFGLRRVPVVGRERERDALWAALRTSHDAGEPRAVVLSGGPGLGKSALAEWLTIRAHELGVANVLSATHDLALGPTHGLARMVATHLNLTDLEPGEESKRIERVLRAQGVVSEYEWKSLTALVRPGETNDDAARATFKSTSERYTALARYLARISRERAIVVFLDDVQWGTDALGFVTHVLQEMELAKPIFFVLTVNRIELETRTHELRMMETLLEGGGVTEIEVAEMSPDDLRALVGTTLQLSDRLLEQVVENAHGSPLYAIQMVAEWVDGGVLEGGRSGFDLVAGSHAPFADSIETVWEDILDRILGATASDARKALTLAAVLGREIVPTELELVCSLQNVDLPQSLIDQLMAMRVLEPTAGGWAFAHASVRDGLIRAAEEEGSLGELHATCATILQDLGDGRSGLNQRLARHLLGAGEHREAVDALLRSARGLMATCEFEGALELLERREEILESMDLASDDRRLADGWLTRATLHRVRWDFDGSQRWAGAARDAAKRNAWPKLEAQALAELGNAARHRGETDAAESLTEDALDKFITLGDHHGVATALLFLAVLSRTRGALDKARDLYWRAYRLFRDLAHPDQAKCMSGLANVDIQESRYDDAQEKLVSAHEIFEAIGDLKESATCINGLAEIARFRGDAATAEEGYREAIRLFAQVGAQSALRVPELNLGILLIQGAKYREALVIFERTETSLEKSGQRSIVAWTRAHILACLPFLSEGVERWPHDFERALLLLGETEFVDVDIARACEQSGDAWNDRGRQREAIQAWALSLKQWRALDRKDRAAVVEEKMRG